MTPNQKGDVGEAKVLSALLRAGFSVSVPWGDNQRYDLLIDNGTEIKRVQVKVGQEENGAINFSLRSTPGRGKNKSYGDAVDVYGVYAPSTDKCYLVPRTDLKATGATLRVAPPKGGQTKNIRWAKDYEITDAQW